MRKSLISYFLCLLISFSIVGCSNSSNIESSSTTPTTTTTTEQSNIDKQTTSPSTTSAPTTEPAKPKMEATTTDNTSYPRNLKVNFLDVGQADSILVELPNDQTMLVDAGNNGDRDTILNYLKSNNIKKIDYLVLTHLHEDHIGSADSVISSFDTGSIYMPKTTTNTKTFEDVLLAIKNKGLKVKAPISGSYILNDNKGLSIQILAPNSATYEDANNYSIVLKVKYKNNSFLLTGDAQVDSEVEILNKGYDIKADVLKVGHHGSHTSTSPAFLNRVDPKYAVISCGKGNDYGHPHKETLDKLAAKDIQVFRTDLDGAITFVSDGNNITVDKKASPIKENAPPAQISTKVSEQTKASDTFYIGNKNSKIFHLPTCSSLPDTKNQIKFSTREEAINAGYRPCKKCNP